MSIYITRHAWKVVHEAQPGLSLAFLLHIYYYVYNDFANRLADYFSLFCHLQRSYSIDWNGIMSASGQQVQIWKQTFLIYFKELSREWLTKTIQLFRTGSTIALRPISWECTYIYSRLIWRRWQEKASNRRPLVNNKCGRGFVYIYGTILAFV